MRFRNKVIISIGVFLLFYIVASMIMFWVKGEEMTEMTRNIFILAGLEGGILGWMRKLDKKECETDDSDNE